jgi:hypothetical protein
LQEDECEKKGEETKEKPVVESVVEKQLLSGKQLTLLSYHEAPSYLQFNPYIRSGYRGYLSTKMCFERY